MTAADRAASGPDRALQAWVSGTLATDLVSDFKGPWDLELARRTTVRFPAPTDVATAAEAALWERRALAVAAECTTRGQAAVWIVPSLTASVLGAATVAGASGVHRGSPLWVSLAASGVSALVLALIGGAIAASIAMPIVRDLHMRAPSWTARAQAYESRRLAIESAVARQAGRRWQAGVRNSARRL